MLAFTSEIFDNHYDYPLIISDMEKPLCHSWTQGLKNLSFEFEAYHQNPHENVATSLSFGMVFRDFRLLYFCSHEKCTQNVLASAVPIMLSFANTREG